MQGWQNALEKPCLRRVAKQKHGAVPTPDPGSFCFVKKSTQVKPSVFIGSSSESLEIAYAVQENLEMYAQITVWTQGIFDLSKYTLDSLLDCLDCTDFGVFVFAPDDILRIRGLEKTAVRDNVIFELGLFTGRLGRERNFIVMPRGASEELHLPTDLLGLTPALFDADRQDENWCAALGPACSKVRRALERYGSFGPSSPQPNDPPMNDCDYSDEDIKAILSSWMGSRTKSANSKVIHFDEVDRELGLPKGSSKRFIKEIATRWEYVPRHEGEHTILFEQQRRPPSRYWSVLP